MNIPDNASSHAIANWLGQRLEQIRLKRNVSPQALTEQAGISSRTLRRMANGQGISLDSFIRILKALDLVEHLATLLPDPSIQPIERINKMPPRQRASGTRRKTTRATDWQWGDDDPKGQ